MQFKKKCLRTASELGRQINKGECLYAVRVKLSEMKGKVTLVISAQGVTKDQN